MRYTPEPFDLESVDEWAVKIVVKEGVFVRLNPTEKIIATVLLRDDGMRAPAIADRLHVDPKDIEAMIRRWERVGKRACAERGFNLLQFQRTGAVQ